MASWIFRAYADAFGVATFPVQPSTRPAPRPGRPEPPASRPRPAAPPDERSGRDAAFLRRSAFLPRAA